MATAAENGDYLYGRKRMREIDRELAHLARRMKNCRVIDPAGRQTDQPRVWFGATVTIADEDDNARVTLTLVGDDEQDASASLIGWSAPMARALRGAAVRRSAQGALARRRKGMGSNGDQLSRCSRLRLLHEKGPLLYHAPRRDGI
jgi:transcription elongation GreA/GreB family factor